MKKIAVVLIPLTLMACSSLSKTDSAQVSDKSAKVAPSDAASNAAPAASAAEVEARRLSDAAALLQKQSIYFDYDKFSVKPAYQGTIEQQADFLKAHKNDTVTIEGNTDERGSEEYNLALAEKRANVAKKDLELLGVQASQISTRSLGESKPRLTCHEEKCWKENRRDDFLHALNFNQSR